MKALLRKYPLPSTLIHDLMTLSPTPPDDFFPQIIFITFASSHLTFTGHSIPTSSGLGSLLSLFFQHDLIKLIHSIVPFPHYTPH